MRGILTFALSLMAAVAWFVASPAPASAASAGVRDDGHFFSADAIEQAGPILQKIRSAHHRDVLVQTYPSIPDSLRGDFESQGKDRFFETWAQRIGRENNVNGIVILACKDPGHLQVVVGNETRKRVFTEADRQELVSQILSAFKAKKYDQGLLDGLRFIQDRMDQNLGNSGGTSGAAATPGGGIGNYGAGATSGRSTSHLGAWVCLGVGALIIVMLVVGMLNRGRGYGGGYGAPPAGGYPPGSYPPGAYPPGYGASGGGFGRGLLGGLLGGALGAWGYDRLSHRGEPGPTYTPGQPPPADQGGGVDTSYSGSGGDFGDAGAGGGDFSSGGGDFGGGGGDFGGGGGDFGGGGDAGGGGGGDSGSGGAF